MKELLLNDFLNREGLISQEKDSLILFDYSRETQFKSDWDEITLNARGIVFERSTRKLIARPFPKFFNYEELIGDAGKKLPENFCPNFKGAFKVLEKMDGSLGIVYWYNGEWRVNTRGSFESDQAIWAKKFLDKNIKTDIMSKGYTYLFEIIYPDNRIVINYGKKEALVLLAMIDIHTGAESPYSVIEKEAELIGSEVPKIYHFEKFEDIFKARDKLTVNEEGFVITFENGYKFKLKGEQYCKIHRILSNITPLHFWRAIDLETFKIFDIKERIKDLPEEFRDMAEQLIKITEDIHQDQWKHTVKLAQQVPKFEMDREGKKKRYLWITNRLKDRDKEYAHNILMYLDYKYKKLSAHNILMYLDYKYKKLRKAIHKRCRPTRNDFQNVKIDRNILNRIMRIMNDLG